MKKSLIIVLSLVGLLAMIGMMAGFFDDKIAPASLPTAKQSQPERLHRMAFSTQVLQESVAATVSSKQATFISARILAPIEKMHVRAGDTVKAGQLLVELDKRQLLSQKSQAEQAVKAVRAQLNDANQTLARVKKLFADKVASQSELDQIANRQQSLAAELARAEQGLSSAATALSYSRIIAPIGGKVVDRFMEPGDTASPGQHLLSLYNPASMRVEAHVREGLALRLNAGQAVTARIPAADVTVNVILEELVPAADPGARTFLVKASLPEGLVVFPGMYAELFVPAGEQQWLTLPQAAIIESGQQHYVWVWQNQQRQRRYVRLGRELRSPEGELYLEILAGLNAEEQVILP